MYVDPYFYYDAADYGLEIENDVAGPPEPPPSGGYPPSLPQDEYLNEGGDSSSADYENRDSELLGNLDSLPESPAHMGNLLIEEIKTFLQTQPQLTDEQKRELEALINTLELDPNAFEGVREKFLEIQEIASHSLLANRLAVQAGVSAEEIESLAKQYGVDLSNPDTDDPQFIRFLAETVPEIKEKVEELQSLAEKKIAQDNEAKTKANERNAQATADRKDTDNMDLSMYKTLLDSQSYEDAGSQDLIRAGNELIERIQTAVEPVSIDLPAVDSSALESASHPLFTALGLNPLSKPELIPMAWDGQGERKSNFNKHDWAAWVRDYPKYEYDGRYRP